MCVKKIMDQSKSKQLEDPLINAERRYKELCLKMSNPDYSSTAPKPSLFPKKKSKRTGRESIVPRAGLIKSVITSTPTPCSKKKEFASDSSLSSISPISNEVLQNYNSQNQLNSDSFIRISSSSLEKAKKSTQFDQLCCPHQCTNIKYRYKELQKNNNEEHLNKIIIIKTSDRKQKQEQLQTSTANSQYKQVDCETQPGPSLTKHSAERISEKDELALTKSKKKEKVDLKRSWPASSSLDWHKNSVQDSILGLNGSANEIALDNTFPPKLPKQRKVFVNKKSRGRPKKDKNNVKKTVTCSTPSVKMSLTNIKLNSQSQYNELIDCKNKTQKTAETTTSTMLQTKHQIEHINTKQEIFKGSKRPVRLEHENLSSDQVVHHLNDGIIQQKLRRSGRERHPATKIIPHTILYESEAALNKMRKNLPEQSLVNINSPQMSYKTLLCNTKIVSHIKVDDNENVEMENLKNKKKQKNNNVEKENPKVDC